MSFWIQLPNDFSSVMIHPVAPTCKPCLEMVTTSPDSGQKACWQNDKSSGLDALVWRVTSMNNIPHQKSEMGMGLHLPVRDMAIQICFSDGLFHCMKAGRWIFYFMQRFV